MLNKFTAISVILAGLNGRAEVPKKITPTYGAQSSAHIELAGEGWKFVTTNKIFEFASVRNDVGDDWAANLLLEQTFRNERLTQGEGIRGRSVVKAWTIKPGHQRKFRWEIQTAANEGMLWNRMLRLTTWGCCSIPNTFDYYSLLSGERIFITHFDLLEVRGGNGSGAEGSRFIGFGFPDMNQSKPTPILQYGSDTGAPQTVSVVSSRSCDSFELPELFLEHDNEISKSLNLIGLPYTFNIILKYPDKLEVRIPIVADEILVDKATLPNGISLHR